MLTSEELTGALQNLGELIEKHSDYDGSKIEHKNLYELILGYYEDSLNNILEETPSGPSMFDPTVGINARDAVTFCVAAYALVGFMENNKDE